MEVLGEEFLVEIELVEVLDAGHAAYFPKYQVIGKNKSSLQDNISHGIWRGTASLTTIAAIATNPGVIDLISAVVARGGGPGRDVPGARVIDEGPRRMTLSICRNIQGLRWKMGQRLTFRMDTPLNILLPEMTPSLYRTGQNVG